MASQTRTYEKKKLLGQIYTPAFIVEKILDNSGFHQLDYSKNSILDPACGDGRFLVPIARYIIENSPKENLKQNLENISGWDIDPEAIDMCLQNLEELVSLLDIKVDWQLHNLDALQQINSTKKFDLIVGNPPYIRIQNLSAEQRQFIQESYSFCKSGSTDAYVAFFQLASTLLTENGICGFVTPNSFLSSETGKPLRSYFSLSQNLRQITNYGSVRIFGNTGTYAAITIFERKRSDTFYYELSDYDLSYQKREISFSELHESNNWHLSVEKKSMTEGKILGEICQISVGITTLSDSIFLCSVLQKKDHLVQCLNKKGNVFWIENNFIKPIVKGSKLKTSSDPVNEFIIFPYEKDENGKHKIIPEKTLAKEYPKAYKYLLGTKKELLKRDNGKPNAVAWYAMGRAQGLDSSFGKKIIFSPMNKFPNFVLYDNPDCTVYSGYFIKYDGDYNFLLAQLNSQRMADFISISGRDFQGGYKGYNKKVVENFVITGL
ncbi:class I SAM-dependent DNA methyltransferase [Dyadobacter sp. CY356]|uniref:HsdM family class I SAM-dependent methyltransferase n=1 Tax=Dyadobacter sp. CY356 TaxID=2906442 RepID=UPI001F1DB60B|nr:N-6 DNA methylase [Dyadobacter sp. CY356]MCF0055658.1 SAM-dependent methyltransferase [Dyadobacter sp. CY356]